MRGLGAAKAIDRGLARAEVEVIELEARRRVGPMNDTQLADALKAALAAKKERLAKLRALHAAAGKPARGTTDAEANEPLPLHAIRRPPLKRSVPQRPKAKTVK